jgi:hypothetical protein
MVLQTHAFDAFISYSHLNEAWVAGKLVPRLTAAQIRFAWDRQHFLPGRPFTTEMVRLMRESRNTLVVMTKEWLESNYTDFEYQLSRAVDPGEKHARIVLLRLDGCELPSHLRRLTRIDLRGPAEASGLTRLVDLLAVQKESRLEIPIGADLCLWKELSTRSGEGYGYAGTLSVGNACNPVLEFDSIQVTTHVPTDAPRRPGAATALRIVLTERGMVTTYAYETPPIFPGTDDVQRRPLQLPPGRALRLPGVAFATLRTSIAGAEPVVCSVAVLRGDVQLSAEVWGVLPPVTRLTATQLGQPDRFSGGPGYALRLLPASLLSPVTGVLDHDLVNRVCESARGFAQDSLLRCVYPQTIEVREMSDGMTLHSANGWAYRFFSESHGGAFDISPQDPTWVDPAAVSKLATKPACWLDESLLSRCWLDASMAYTLALSACPGVAEHGGFVLEARPLEGVWRPVWCVPREYEGAQAGVLADTGELVVFEGDGVVKPRGIIWNA